MTCVPLKQANLSLYDPSSRISYQLISDFLFPNYFVQIIFEAWKAKTIQYVTIKKELSKGKGNFV